MPNPGPPCSEQAHTPAMASVTQKNTAGWAVFGKRTSSACWQVVLYTFCGPWLLCAVTWPGRRSRGGEKTSQAKHIPANGYPTRDP